MAILSETIEEIRLSRISLRVILEREELRRTGMMMRRCGVLELTELEGVVQRR